MAIAPSINARRQHGFTHGFTLVEILIVVMVIAIVSALAVPMLMDTDDTKIIGAADILAADMAYAQIESITHGDDPRVVVFDADNDRYLITTQSAIAAAITGGSAAKDATPINNPVGNEPYELTFGQREALVHAGVTITNINVGGDDQLGFGIYGELDQTTSASITLGAGDRRIDLTLDPITGETTIGLVYTP